MSDDRTASIEALGPELFHPATAALVATVCVLTARRNDGTPCGLTALSVASYSAQPPSLLVSVARQSGSHAAFENAGRFAINLLARDQENVAHAFASSSDDKFEGIGWCWDDDLPAIQGALAVLRCSTSARFEHHDHSILIGDLVGGSYAEGEPLVHCRRRMDWQLG